MHLYFYRLWPVNSMHKASAAGMEMEDMPPPWEVSIATCEGRAATRSQVVARPARGFSGEENHAAGIQFIVRRFGAERVILHITMEEMQRVPMRNHPAAVR